MAQETHSAISDFQYEHEITNLGKEVEQASVIQCLYFLQLRGQEKKREISCCKSREFEKLSGWSGAITGSEKWSDI